MRVLSIRALSGFTLTYPTLVVAFINHAALAAVLSVLTVVTYWAVNEVCNDLEVSYL